MTPTSRRGPAGRHAARGRARGQGRDDPRAAAIDRIACRLLEHVSGIEQVETRKTRGPAAAPTHRGRFSRLAIDHAAGTEDRARPVDALCAAGPGAIAIQLADFAELLEDAELRGTPVEAGDGRRGGRLTRPAGIEAGGTACAAATEAAQEGAGDRRRGKSRQSPDRNVRERRGEHRLVRRRGYAGWRRGCELPEPRYRQQVLKRAVESAERARPARRHRRESGSWRTGVRWAAGTTGARTDADVVRWMEKRHVALPARGAPSGKRPADTRSTGDAAPQRTAAPQLLARPTQRRTPPGRRRRRGRREAPSADVKAVRERAPSRGPTARRGADQGGSRRGGCTRAAR